MVDTVVRVVELACVDVDFRFVSLANVDIVGEVKETDAEGYIGSLCSDVQFLKHMVRHLHYMQSGVNSLTKRQRTCMFLVQNI